VALAALGLRNTFQCNLDVVTTTAPCWFLAFTTSRSAAHILTVPSLFHWLWMSIFSIALFPDLTAASVLLWYTPQRVFNMTAAA
jgi:hypothetical protein